MALAVFADGGIDQSGIVFSSKPVTFGIRSHCGEKTFGFPLEQKLAHGIQFLRAALVDAFVQPGAQFPQVGRGELAHM
jgi:hypothetical protein